MVWNLIKKNASVQAFLVILLLAALSGGQWAAAEENQVVIEEEGSYSGGVGGQGRVSNDGFDVRIRVQPETTYRKKTTITTRGAPQTSIRVYKDYPGCPSHCDPDLCYPSSHECRDCNRYHASPCPPY